MVAQFGTSHLAALALAGLRATRIPHLQNQRIVETRYPLALELKRPGHVVPQFPCAQTHRRQTMFNSSFEVVETEATHICLRLFPSIEQTIKHLRLDPVAGLKKRVLL